jgi:hypothetical protein
MKHLPITGQSVLFRLLRPEFLQTLKNDGMSSFCEQVSTRLSFGGMICTGSPPLSPDAFTLWGAIDHVAHNTHVERATTNLLTHVIPSFVKHLEAMSFEELKLLALNREFHRWGVNIRHMGIVRASLVNIHARHMLLVDMVARTLKNIMRQSLRNEMRRQAGVGNAYGHVYRELMVTFLNMVSGAHKKSPQFWGAPVTRGLQRRFGDIALTVDEQTSLFSWSRLHMIPMVQYVSRTVGIQLSTQCYQAFLHHEELRPTQPTKVNVR